MSKPSAMMVRISLTLVNTMETMLIFMASRNGYIHEGQWSEIHLALFVLTLHRRLQRY